MSLWAESKNKAVFGKVCKVEKQWLNTWMVKLLVSHLQNDWIKAKTNCTLHIYSNTVYHAPPPSNITDVFEVGPIPRLSLSWKCCRRRLQTVSQRAANSNSETAAHGRLSTLHQAYREREGGANAVSQINHMRGPRLKRLFSQTTTETM